MYVCMLLVSTFSNISFQTTGPIEAKIHVKPPYNRGMKVRSKGPGHMTKMAAMPIYGKNLKKSSSSEPKGIWPWNVVCSIGFSSTTKFVQIMTLGWQWPILREGQIWSIVILYEKKAKTMDFSETFVVYEIKVCKFSYVTESMNLYQY